MTFEPTPEVLEAVARAIHEKLAPFEVFGEDTSNVKFARETAAHVIAAYEVAQWQPIESAPKDGTWVLLWCGWCIEGRWFEKGERVKNNWSDDGMGVNPIFNVTHWRPLPPPPA